MTIADTDFFIDVMNPVRAHHARAVAAAERFDASDEPLWVSALTRFELATGCERYVDPPRERARVQALLEGYPTLAFTAEIAERAGRIHGALARGGRALGAVDAMIAATALEQDAAVLSRNVREFRRVQGLRVDAY